MKQVLISACLAILFLLVPACQDEVFVHLDAPLKKPMIYCILKPGDSVQYLRVERVFLGKGDVQVAAKNPDSVYFQEVEAHMERWESGQLKEVLPFRRNAAITKENGYFASAGHVIYEMQHQLVSGNTYRLQVDVPELGLMATSVTVPQSELRVIRWNGWPANTINMVNEQFSTVEWEKVPGVGTYTLTYIFHYYEITDTDTTHHEVAWKMPEEIYTQDSSDPVVTYQVPISQWFGVLSDHILRKESVRRRIAGRFDLLWEFQGAELEAFLQRANLANKEMWLDYPIYSNINEGIGIFSFATRYRVNHIGISLYTLERITTHPLTKDLKFDARTDWGF